MMSKLIHFLMLSCKKAAELIEKRHSFGLNALEKAQLTMHKKICATCALYEEQNTFIHDALTKHIQDPNNAEKQELEEKEKEEIKTRLQE